ncbi:MAG: HYR domain-containing protein [Acidobacteria bacterium]|nr:HYR domain-containing protein [Acidobacteriota bacterium]
MSKSSTVKLGFSFARFVVLPSLLIGLMLIERSNANPQTAQPKIVIAGWTLTAEDCRMPDGLVDPGEAVTLNIALQNTGGTNTSQQVLATLQASGGVTSPSGQQDYGRLSAGGPSTGRNFTFTAAAQQLGTPITLTLQISDGGVNRGTVSTTITLGLLVSDADPGLCQTGFNPPRSPSPCILTHCVSSRRPPFPVGNYTVICDTDAPSRFTMLLSVRDTQPPTMACSPGVTVSAANGVSEIVTYPMPIVTDNCQASAECIPPSGSAFQVGTTRVNCTATDSSGNTANCAFAVTVNQGIGLPISPATAPSDQLAGSVLAFPVYTSSATSPQAQNTRIAITNVEPTRSAFVHLFFVSEACSVADSFICLTAQQTAHFLTSDIDPGTTGYLIAVATDSTGCPANFNFLIGSEFVKFLSGHAASLPAQAFAALPGWQACAGGATSAMISFDGVKYSQAARTVAASNLSSRADGNESIVFINRLGGDFRTGASTLGTISGLLYDDAENALSVSRSGGCQLRLELTSCLPCPGPRFESFIPSGRTGWLRLYSQSDIAIFGAGIVTNPNVRATANAFNQGHNLHTLTLTNSASITIPVLPPTC